MGRLIDLTRPHVSLYAPAPMMFDSDALLYWMSPRGSTAAMGAPTSRFEVAPWWHVVSVTGSPGAQAMSPEAAMTGSCATAAGDHTIATATAMSEITTSRRMATRVTQFSKTGP